MLCAPWSCPKRVCLFCPDNLCTMIPVCLALRLGLSPDSEPSSGQIQRPSALPRSTAATQSNAIGGPEVESNRIGLSMLHDAERRRYRKVTVTEWLRHVTILAQLPHGNVLIL